MFTAAGLYSQLDLLLLAAALLPFALLGLFLGNHLYQRLPVQLVMQAIWLVLILGGVTLIWRSATGG